MGEAKRRKEANKGSMLDILQGNDIASYKCAQAIAEMWTDAKNPDDDSDANFIIKIRGMLDGITQLIDIATKVYHEKGKAECARGCYFCCRQMVTMSPVELFVLSYHIMLRFSEEEYKTFAERLNTFIDLPVNAREMAGRWCPLLVKNECSVYDVRPISCRTHLSQSREKCESTDLFGANVPYIGNTKVVGLSCRMAIEYILMRDYGVNIEPVELTHGLLIVLQDFQGVFEAWANGKNVFIQAQEQDKEFSYTALVKNAGEKIYEGTIKAH